MSLRRVLIDALPLTVLFMAIGLLSFWDASLNGFQEHQYVDEAASGHGDGTLTANTRVQRRNLFSPDSIYANRTLVDRTDFVKNVGGTIETEQAVEDGLDWLARHQAKDGSWSHRCIGSGAESRCEKDHACSNPGGDYIFAQTALPVLAFQASGNFHFNRGQYSDHVRRALDWMIEYQGDDGRMSRPASGIYYMYEHGIATFALAEACAAETATPSTASNQYRRALVKAVEYMLTQQHADGGWRYDDNKHAPSDTSVTGWQMLALKTAREADIAIPQDAIERMAEFFRRCELNDRGRTAYDIGRQLSEATTGVGMLVHQLMLKKTNSQLVAAAAPHLADYAEKTWGLNPNANPDYYLWYNCSLAMFQAGGEPWRRWNAIVRDRLRSKQVQEGCERGSWPAFDSHDSAGGRIYTTSLAVLTLEVYYRFSTQ